VPKVVDVGQRRTELAEAVWRVIRRDGLQRASVRNVAREAGLSMGALRHYFATQDELLRMAMALVTERVRARIERLAGVPASARERAQLVLEEVLPLDDDRRSEAEVWLALAGRALVDPGLAAVRDDADSDLHGLCAAVVTGLVESGEATPGLDLPLEVDRLHALLDGLALHALIRPGRLPTEQVRAVLGRHLDALVGRTG
jgi:AcrR family transcriptional regulator